MFWIGVAVGFVPTVLVLIDDRLAEYDEPGPIRRVWRSGRSRLRSRVGSRVLAASRGMTGRVRGFGPVARLLARRRWRVSYVSSCIYGHDPAMGGVPPWTIAESWHWTRRGADWHRRHRPNYVGWGSFQSVTVVEHAPAAPFDPIAEWSAEAAS